MGFIDNIKGMFNSNTKVVVTSQKEYVDMVIPDVIGKNTYNGQPESIAAVYASVKILSETLSKLPLNIYFTDGEGRRKAKEHYLWDILHYNPNNYLTSQSFIQTIEVHKNLKGNGYARINRDGNTGRVKNLEIISPTSVVGNYIEKGELYYKISVKDKETPIVVDAMDVLHVRHMSRDGINGITPISALALNLSSTYKGLKTIDSFYENNATTGKAIKSTISGANQKAMLEALEQFKKEYAGASNAGKIIPLPPNSELQDLTMNFVDAEFINTLKWNGSQVMSLYGVPSFLMNDAQSSKYSNIEQTMLSFKTQTIGAIIRAYRQEMEFKLLTSQERKDGYSIEFNPDAMVEIDYVSKIQGLKELQGMGVLSPNDVAKMMGFPAFDGGEQHLIFNQFIDLADLKKENKEIL